MLHELKNPNLLDWEDSGWIITRFRPLITLEDDISMFTALTNMSPIETYDDIDILAEELAKFRLKEMMDK